MQEAALAKELVFQFANDVVAHDILSKNMTDAYLNVGEQSHLFGAKANDTLGQLRNIQQVPSTEENFPIVSFWRSLRFRSTSRQSDVAICASILLGNGLETVLSASDVEKMQAFWSCQPTVPTSILWANGPRLRVDGFRWAPSNLLNPVTAALAPDHGATAATPTSAGLLIAGVDAVILENVPLPSDEAIVFRFKLPSTQKKYFCYKFLRENPETWAEVKHLWNGRCALLLSQFLWSRSRATGALVLPTSSLVDDPGDEQKTKPIAVRYLANVNVLAEIDPSEDGMVRTNDGCDALRNTIKLQMTEVLDITDSRNVDSCWRWCVF